MLPSACRRESARGLGNTRIPRRSAFAVTVNATTATRRPPIKSPPIVRDPACHTERPAKPSPMPAAVTARTGSAVTTCAARPHTDVSGRTPGRIAPSTSRLKMTAGLMVRIVRSGHRLNRRVFSTPKPKPFESGASAVQDSTDVNSTCCRTSVASKVETACGKTVCNRSPIPIPTALPSTPNPTACPRYE